MCQLKSGIILKNRVFISAEYNSHSKMLKELGIEDTNENAMTKFVRAELIPSINGKRYKNNKFWINPSEWKFKVDQDYLPDWFGKDKEKYEEMFREEVVKWWNKYVLIDREIEELSEDNYYLYGCKVGRLINNITIKRCYNSTIREMQGNIEIISGNSSVGIMYDYSTIEIISGNSVVNEMWDNSKIIAMWDNSIVKTMHDHSIVKRMWDNSKVGVMQDESMIEEMYDCSGVRVMYNKSKLLNKGDFC